MLGLGLNQCWGCVGQHRSSFDQYLDWFRPKWRRARCGNNMLTGVETTCGRVQSPENNVLIPHIGRKRPGTSHALVEFAPDLTNLAESWPTSPDLVKFSKHGPNSRRNWPSSPPVLADIAAELAEFAQTRPDSRHNCPTSPKHRRNRARNGRFWIAAQLAGFVRTWPKSRQSWPMSAKHGRNRARIGHHHRT